MQPKYRDINNLLLLKKYIINTVENVCSYQVLTQQTCLSEVNVTDGLYMLTSFVNV